MFKNIKEKIGKSQLKKTFKHRKRKVVAKNFDDITNIGIIYTANKESDITTIKNLIKTLPSKIKVSCLGYFNEKNLKDFHLQTDKHSFFCSSDLNWFFKPVSETVKDFTHKPFDVLIDLNKEKSIPMDFILFESKAHLIVGRYNKKAIYDFMINVEKNDSDLYFLEQTVKYLKMINHA